MRFMLIVLMTLGLTLPAAADQLIASYVTVLSRHDHYNSSGTRLNSAAAVIAQDRANFHRFGRADPGDEWDGFFTSTGRRQMVDGMLNRAGVASYIRNTIINSEVVVSIEIYSGVGNGPYMTVWVH